jgi:hypothetical protein
MLKNWFNTRSKIQLTLESVSCHLNLRSFWEIAMQGTLKKAWSAWRDMDEDGLKELRIVLHLFHLVQVD